VDKPAAAPVTGAEYDEPAQLSALVVEKPARTGLFSRRDRAEPSLGSNSAAAEEGSEPPLLLDTLALEVDDRNDNDELLPWDDEPVVTQTSRKPRAAVAAEPLAIPIQPLEKRESKPSERAQRDRKSTRLNSSHVKIS